MTGAGAGSPSIILEFWSELHPTAAVGTYLSRPEQVWERSFRVWGTGTNLSGCASAKGWERENTFFLFWGKTVSINSATPPRREVKSTCQLGIMSEPRQAQHALQKGLEYGMSDVHLPRWAG